MNRSELTQNQRLSLANEARLILDKAIQFRAWMLTEKINPRDPIWIANLRIISGAEMLRDNALKVFKN